MTAKPKGKLTGAQLEIMEILWRSERAMTAAEIWQELQQIREVTRPTVSTVLARLEKRGWLSREGEGRGATFMPTSAREQAMPQVAYNLFDELFGGSPRRFVMSLLGSEKLSPEQAQHLRTILEGFEEDSK